MYDFVCYVMGPEWFSKALGLQLIQDLICVQFLELHLALKSGFEQENLRPLSMLNPR